MAGTAEPGLVSGLGSAGRAAVRPMGRPPKDFTILVTWYTFQQTGFVNNFYQFRVGESPCRFKASTVHIFIKYIGEKCFPLGTKKKDP